MNLSQLSPRERNLALMLGVTAFLILNILFLPKLMTGNRTAKQRNVELKAELAASESWIKQQAYWDKRKKWLEETEPELTGDRRDSATQLEDLQKAARAAGIKIDEVQLLQLPVQEFYHPVGARFTVSGTWENMVKFLQDAQEPDQFDVIPKFSIKSDQEPPNVICEMEMQRWFRLPEEAAK